MVLEIDKQLPNDKINVTTNIDEPNTNRIKRPAFELCVKLEMNVDLAFALAHFILDSGCDNPAILAFAHQIVGNQKDDKV